MSNISYQNVDREGHHEPGHQEVGQGQRHDEEVGHVLKQPLLGHAEDDEHVAEDDEDAEGEQDHGPVVLAGVLARADLAVLDRGRDFVSLVFVHDLHFEA